MPSAGEDPTNTSVSFPGIGNDIIRDWAFWDADPAYQESYNSVDENLGLVTYDVWVSYDTVLPAAGIVARTEYDSSSQTYSVMGDLDGRSIAFLRNVYTSQTSEADGDVYDWFDVRRPSGQAVTPMRLIFVAENKAYRMFNVGDVLNAVDTGNLSSYTVTLADGLTQSDADELVDRL